MNRCVKNKKHIITPDKLISIAVWEKQYTLSSRFISGLDFPVKPNTENDFMMVLNE